jgi:hypothetical protein
MLCGLYNSIVENGCAQTVVIFPSTLRTEAAGPSKKLFCTKLYIHILLSTHSYIFRRLLLHPQGRLSYAQNCCYIFLLQILSCIIQGC